MTFKQLHYYSIIIPFLSSTQCQLQHTPTVPYELLIYILLLRTIDSHSKLVSTFTNGQRIGKTVNSPMPWYLFSFSLLHFPVLCWVTWFLGINHKLLFTTVSQYKLFEVFKPSPKKKKKKLQLSILDRNHLILSSLWHRAIWRHGKRQDPVSLLN